MPGISDSHDSTPKAAIIDQLSLLDPNPELITRATQLLEASGFSVDLWQGEDVNIDFLKNLPGYNYKLIFFRAHLGIQCLVNVNDPSDIIPKKITGLFTGEIYSPIKHGNDQMRRLVYEGVMDDKYPSVFSLGSAFVEEGMKDNFHDTMIIMMGCASFYNDDMAKAFIDRGASVYIGWNATVTLDYLDKATVKLLENILQKNMTVAGGITNTMKEVGNDPYSNAHLKYLLRDTGGQTMLLSQLIGIKPTK
jgi:hypothetical protein